MLVLSLYFPQHARAMAACLPWKDHVWIAIEYFVRFHNNELDGILCKLDSTDNPSSFELYQTCLKNIVKKSPKFRIKK